MRIKPIKMRRKRTIWLFAFGNCEWFS